MKKSASRNSWRVSPLPDLRTKLAVDRQFTAREYERLSRGLIPVDMDDRWFIFMEDDTLFFHRSWTGECIYEVRFDAQRSIREVWANRDPQQYLQTDDEEDRRQLLTLIGEFLRGALGPSPELGVGGAGQ